jgi:chemotaxis family two-component system response regulator PixG
MINTVLNLNAPLSTSLEKSTFNPNKQIFSKCKIRDFNVTKQTQLFEDLKTNQFSGQLVIEDRQGKGIKSIFYLFLGRIVFAGGGYHPIRRWSRYLSLYCPEMISNAEVLKQDLQKIIGESSFINWQYSLLSLWVKQQKLNREQTSGLIKGIIEEVLFDLTQSRKIKYELKPEKMFINSTPLILINSEEVIVQVWKLWQAWQNTTLGTHSPNLAPVITNLAQLEAQTSPMTCKMLKQNLDGKTTLRDLAVQLRQSILQLSRALGLYIQSGVLDLVGIEDLPVPGPIPEKQETTTTKNVLVAYVDDSHGMSQRMKQIVVSNGYQFLSIKDESKIIAVCLEQKPDIIFIHMKTSHTHIYNLTLALRQFDVFRKTPIFIMSANFTMIERIRAKMAGISDVIELFAQPETINTVIEKSYLS